MSGQAERIKKLLVYITDHTRVANIVGCDPSYISQLMSDPEFSDQVIGLRMLNGEKHIQLDSRADELEGKLLEKLERMVPMMMRPGEVVNAYKVLNNARRRLTQDNAPTSQGLGTLVSIKLPAAAQLAFKLSQKGEVIEIDGQPMVTMPSAELLTLAESRGTNYGQELGALRERITAASEAAELEIAARSAGNPGRDGNDESSR